MEVVPILFLVNFTSVVTLSPAAVAAAAATTAQTQARMIDHRNHL